MKEKVEKKIEYHSNGTICIEYHLNKKGQYHGSYKSCWKDGTVSWQTEFKNNQRNGFLKDKWHDGSFHYINTQNKHERFGLHIDFYYFKK